MGHSSQFERIFIRGISDLSYHNGVGLGMADVVHQRLVDEIDWTPTQINSLTASTPAAIRTPVHFDQDRVCLEKIAPTVGKLDIADVTMGWVRNSAEINLIALTANLREKIEKAPNLEIVSTLDWPFDSRGNLPGLPSLAAHASAH